MKLIIAALSLFIGVTGCLAQSKVEIRPETKKTGSLIMDLGVNPGLLIHYYGQRTTTIGVDLRLQNKISNKASWMASAGYTHFDGIRYSSDILTIKAGIKIFMATPFYFAGEIGLGEYLNGGELLILTPSAGILLGKKWDVALKYEGYSNLSYVFSQIGVRVGYRLFK